MGSVPFNTQTQKPPWAAFVCSLRNKTGVIAADIPQVPSFVAANPIIPAINRSELMLGDVCL
jgi:hypothetical protein